MELEPHTPYAERCQRNPDFVVEYIWKPDQELSTTKCFQGIRSDFLYAGDGPQKDGIHMIYPEFLDHTGHVILQKDTEVERYGFANMWILMQERVSYHIGRLQIGSKGHMVAGSKKLAEVTVVQINFET